MKSTSLFIFLLTGLIYNQIIVKETNTYSSYGVIQERKGDSINIAGSAFVFFNPNLVITCLHVIHDSSSSYYYQPANSGTLIHLAKKKIFPNLDIAILSLPEEIKIQPLEIDTIYGYKIGDPISYLGFDRPKSDKEGKYMMSVAHSNISLLYGTEVKFEGYAFGGFSGGPILNINKKVIGMIQKGKDFIKAENKLYIYGILFNAELIRQLVPD